MILFDGAKAAPIFVDTNTCEAVRRAVEDLAEDFARVRQPSRKIERQISQANKFLVIIGTLNPEYVVRSPRLCRREDVSRVPHRLALPLTIVVLGATGAGSRRDGNVNSRKLFSAALLRRDANNS